MTLPPRKRGFDTAVDGAAPTYRVCGVRIAALDASDAAAWVAHRASSGSGGQVHLCNAYTLALATKDARLSRSLDVADLNLPDGAPVAWLGHRTGIRKPVRGPELVRRVVAAGVTTQLRHYLYGGADGVAQEMSVQIRSEVPGTVVVGTETPPWTELDDDALAALAERINRAGADIVWVGLGTPRQDYLVERLAPLTDSVVVPVGAAFDFIAGRVPEAPKYLHGTGLEWTFRLRQEPRRLWTRYLLWNFRFVGYAAISGRRSRVHPGRG